MNRPAAPVLAAIVFTSALIGFALGWFAGRNPSPFHAAPMTPFAKAPTLGTSTADDARAEGPKLVSVDAPPRAGSAGSDPRKEFARAMLDSAIRRTPASSAEVPSGQGVITGVVKTKAGEPLAGIEVHATPLRHEGPTRRSSSDRAVGKVHRDIGNVLTAAAQEWIEGEGSARSTTSGADGTFRIEGLADLYVQVGAQGEGYSFATREHSVLNPVEQPDAAVHIEGQPLIGVHVSVVDQSGNALEKAIVSVDGVRMNWSAEDPIVYGTSIQMRLQAFAEPLPTTSYGAPPKFISEPLDVDAAADPGRIVTLKVEAACIVRGRIVGEKVAYEEWQKVHAVPLGRDEQFDASVPQSNGIETYLNSDMFIFPDLRPGRYAVCLIGSGSIPSDHEVVDVGPGVLEITLDRERHDASRYIQVRGLSPKGTSVDSYKTSFEYQTRESEVQSDWMPHSRMPNGTRLLDLSDFTEFDYDAWPSDAKAWVVATSSIYGKVRIPLVSGQREVVAQFQEACELSVRLEGDISAGGFNVRILEGDTGRAEPPELHRARQTGGRHRARIKASGEAHFRALSPGPVIVSLSQSGQWWDEGRELARREVVLTGKDHRVSLDVPPTSDLEVVVTPCPGRRHLNLTITDEGGEVHRIRSLNTSDDGRAVFRGLTRGEYEIRDQESGAKFSARVPGPELRIDLSDYAIRLRVSVSKLDGKLTEWGLEGGDLIVAVDGKSIEGGDMLLDILHSRAVTVSVERGHKLLEVDLPRYPRKTRGGNPLGGSILIHSD